MILIVHVGESEDTEAHIWLTTGKVQMVNKFRGEIISTAIGTLDDLIKAFERIKEDRT